MPDNIPVTTPVEEPMVAIDGSMIVQVPPGILSVKVPGAPISIPAGPDIVPGLVVLKTVITSVADAMPQMPVKVQLIVSVPAAIPVTTPLVLIVAIEVLLLPHIPADRVSHEIKVIVLPTQTVEGPVIVPV